MVNIDAELPQQPRVNATFIQETMEEKRGSVSEPLTPGSSCIGRVVKTARILRNNFKDRL